MKTTSTAILALVSLVAASHAQDATVLSGRPPMRKAPTNQELIVQLRQSEQEMAAAASTKPASTSVDLQANANQVVPDLYSTSELLCYNGAFTLVPKSAVLQFPQNLADRLKQTPGAKVQNWIQFYTANRNWITTVEVTKAQASGAQALPEETNLHMAKCGKLVVATFRGNPVSVSRPPAPPAEGAEKAPAATDAAPSAPAAGGAPRGPATGFGAAPSNSSASATRTPAKP